MAVLAGAALSWAHTDLPADSLIRWMAQGPPFDFILIDVRDPPSLDTSAIAGDSCKPYNLSWNRHVFDTAVAAIPHDMPVVVYCRTGVRSNLAATCLDQQGFSNIYDLLGGIRDWTGPTGTSADVLAEELLPTPSMRAPRTSTILCGAKRCLRSKSPRSPPTASHG